MEISIKSIILLSAVVLTGLSAGFFYAWSVSVIPGTQKVIDSTYLQTMQSINRAILNPSFFLIFFGSMVLLVISSFTLYGSHKAAFYLLLSSAIVYIVGTFGVTGLGNVPLNNQLDVLNLASMGSAEMEAFRKLYEGKWNRLHLIRTVCAVASFVLSVISIYTYSK